MISERQLHYLSFFIQVILALELAGILWRLR